LFTVDLMPALLGAQVVQPGLRLGDGRLGSKVGHRERVDHPRHQVAVGEDRVR